MQSKPTSEFAVMDRQLLRYIRDELWPTECADERRVRRPATGVVTSQPVRKAIGEADAPAFLVSGTIDLMFAA